MEWKSIEGFEGLYDLRSDGLLYIYPRKGTKGGYIYGSDNGKGRLKVCLSGNGKQIWKKVHILVYETFIGQIPKGYDVHHINHNPIDNRVENLCIIESKKHRTMHYEEMNKTVLQYTKESQFVTEFPSAIEASRKTGINQGSISRCCRGNGKTAGGYIWKYKETVA